jgi:hypothetical protein
MTKLLAMICVAAIFSIGLTSPSVQANDSEITRRSFQGIGAMSVEVESLSDGAIARKHFIHTTALYRVSPGRGFCSTYILLATKHRIV